jgi:hypothetical protein
MTWSRSAVRWTRLAQATRLVSGKCRGIRLDHLGDVAVVDEARDVAGGGVDSWGVGDLEEVGLHDLQDLRLVGMAAAMPLMARGSSSHMSRSQPTGLKTMPERAFLSLMLPPGANYPPLDREEA